MTLLEEYDSVEAPLIALVRLVIDGKPGCAAEAQRLLLGNDEDAETLAGRLHHLRNRIAQASEAEVPPDKDHHVFIKARRKVG